jgi:hypothetical protein
MNEKKQRTLAQLLRGKGEGLLHGVSGAAGSIAGGLAGAGDIAFNPWSSLEGAGQTQQKVQRALTYQPQTPEGQEEIASAAEAPAARAMQYLGNEIPEKIGGRLQDVGLPAALAASIVSGLEIAPNLVGGKGKTAARGSSMARAAEMAPLAERAVAEVVERPPGRPGAGGGAGGGGGGIEDTRALIQALKQQRGAALPWEQFTEPQAAQVAKAGVHLREKPEGGYVGGPEALQGREELGAQRKLYDTNLEAGAESGALGWYDRSKQALTDVTADSQAQHQLSGLESAYSPNKPVPASLNYSFEHLGRRALMGEEDAQATMPGNRREARAAGAILRGETPQLGPKVDPYWQNLSVLREGEPNTRAVNDTHIAQIFQHPKGEGFGDTQHSFMHGEQQLALARALKKGVLPEGSTVKNAQESAWGGKRYLQAVEEHAEELAAADPQTRALLLEQLRKDATADLGTLLPDFQANDTYESAIPWARAGSPDPHWESLGIPQRPTTKGLGEFRTTEEKPIIEPAIRYPPTGEMWTGPMHYIAAGEMPPEYLEQMPDTTMGNGDWQGDKEWFGFKKHPEGKFLTRQDAAQLVEELTGRDHTYGYTGDDGMPAIASEQLPREASSPRWKFQ